MDDLRDFSPFRANGNRLPLPAPLEEDPELALSDADSASRRQKSVDIGLFAKFPNKLFGSGLARRLGASACVLYFALCENANREASNTFKAKDRDLAWETGLSPRTIRNARIKLLEHGLVEYSRSQLGERYTYVLIRQELGWFKKDERSPRQKRKPRGRTASSATHGP